VKPLQLYLENFGSFVEPQRFHFPHKPGLYFMWGKNVAEPRLQANGAGKSTVWNALTWLFYGRNTKGLKASDIANWGVGKKTKVALIYLDSNGAPCRVTRTWSPNSWTFECSDHYHDAEAFGDAPVIDLDKGTSSELMDALRLDFTAFTQTVVMPQGSELFMELKPDAQTALFSDAMGLERWIKFSERASARARSEDMEVRRLERDLSHIDGRLAAARDVDTTAEYNAFEDERERRLALINDQMYELSSATIDPDKEVKWAADRVDDLRKEWRKRKDAVTDVEQRRHLAMRDYGAACSSVGHARDGLESVRDMQRNPEEYNTCPTCHKPMGKGLELREHNHKEITRLSNLLTQCEATERELYRKQLELNNDFEAARKALFKTEDELDAAEDALKAAQRLKSETKAAWDRLEREEEEWKRKVNPHKKMRDELRTTIRNLESERKTVMQALNQAETAFAASSAWVRGFKEIRLAQIQDALDQLSIEVNNQVVANGLEDWELVFGIDRESKGGSIQRGFNISVYSPHNKKSVPWKAWSGGESQRLIISGQQGFANLVRAHTGTQLDLEVWDEPTTGMSEQGVKDLLESLHARAHAEGRQIWVVDHHTLGYNKFDGAMGVIKGPNGSYFKEGFPTV